MDQEVVDLSYLKPVAFLSESLLSLRVSHHLSFFLVPLTAENGTATSFSPTPRNPPTPIISAVMRPSLSIKTSSTSPTKQPHGPTTDSKKKPATAAQHVGTAESVSAAKAEAESITPVTA